MPALVHTTFRVSNAKQFKESFEEKTEHGVGGYIPMSLMYIDPITLEPSLTGDITSGSGGVDKVNAIPFYALDDQMYLFIGRVSAWNSRDTPDGSIDPNINENNPPYPVDSMKDAHFNHWDDMIAAKKVSAKEVSHVIKRERADEIKEGVRNWTRGMRYDTYDDRADNLFDDDIMIHTVNERFRVYKCIKQGVGRFVNLYQESYLDGVSGIDPEYIDTTSNPGNPSIWVWDHASYREPKNTKMEAGVSEDFMVVGGDFQDGYQWKYYYTIDAGEALKFVTTSYIPVRTIRKENGSREDDHSDQWNVEEAAQPGAILNVLVDKVPVEGLDGTVYGYELTGGGAGYVQVNVSEENGAIEVDTTGVNTIIKFKVGTSFGSVMGVAFADAMSRGDIPQTWPEMQPTTYGKQNNDNRFDFTNAGTLASLMAATAAEVSHFFKNYGVVISGFGAASSLSDAQKEILQRYVFPVESVAISGGDLEFSINSPWVSERKDVAVFDNSILGLDGITVSNEPISFQIQPKVNITTNHQSSTVSDRTDSFEAYAIVEPFYDIAAEEYVQTQLGRIVDVRVTNPGRFHYRIDSAWVSPQPSNDTSTNAVITVADGGEAWNTHVYDLGHADMTTLSGAAGSALTSKGNRDLKNAKIFACIPPVGGHGFDPVGELGGFNVMINARFEGTEADEFTVGNEFRKIGILKNPLKYANTAPGYEQATVRTEMNNLWMSEGGYKELFRGYKTDQCYRLNLDMDSRIVDTPSTAETIFFEPDMEVEFRANNNGFAAETWPSATRKFNGAALQYADGDLIATAKLVDHDKINKRIRVIKPRGDFYTILQGTPPGSSNLRVDVVSRTPHSVKLDSVFALSKQEANTAEEPGMLPGSGQILYVENRSMVSRSQNQTEDLKISIQF